MIDKATAQRIKDAADIVDVVGDYVRLVRRGANYMGLCPFHNERTPSFSVNKSKNFCYCFSCHKGGSPVNFIMEKEGLSYHDALLHLANKYGIKVEERELSDEERNAQNEREAMLVANEWAMRKMENDMRSTEEGRDVGLQYFYQRGVIEEAIKEFHLGYALDQGWELTNAARKEGINLNILKILGLIGTSQQGREYDKFRGRVIFPIINTSGKVIAFGGRDLKGGIAKYINSPESELYKKNRELYGIYQARQAILKEDRCFLVEGYMDVIGMWQSGLRNVVASSGTALTDGQINLIHRFTKNVTLIYDGDAAGIKASLRGIDMLLSHDLNVKVLLLPDGHDPDSFSKQNSAEDFRKYVAENETDILKFKARILMENGLNDPQSRIDAVKSMVQSLACISDNIKLDIYIQECSELLGVAESTISMAVAKEKDSRMEKDRKESERRQRMGETETGVKEPMVDNTRIAELNESARKLKEAVTNPLYGLEKKIMEYCVKYGFIDLVIKDSNSGEDLKKNVIDIVDDEMNADSITFSVAPFSKIFDEIKALRDEYRLSLDAKIIDIDQEIESRRHNSVEAIAASDLTVSDIEKRERQFEKEMEVYKASELYEFSRQFLSRELASHEDSDIRLLVIELIKEKHQLSHIYTKDNQAVDREEDRLFPLVIRALNEWKYEIINQKIKSMFAMLGEATVSGDSESEHRIQMDITMLMQFRSALAKEIGDRIVSPGMNQK